MKKSLAEAYPDLVEEWADRNKKMTPEQITYGSNKIVWWKGRCGHEWQASVKNRAVGKSGCPYCSHNRILVGFNDLASQVPDVAAQWSKRNLPLTPDQVMAYSNQKAWWECQDCGYEWHTHISTRTGGSQCPCCSGLTLVEGKNDLATTHPSLAKEWSERNVGTTPKMVNAKSRQNVWWKCNVCGNEWKGVIEGRVGGRSCPVCSNRAVLPGYNDLETTDSNILKEWDFERNKGISPKKITRQSCKSVWWKCTFGHSWKDKIVSRTIDGAGCKVCEREFQEAFPALIVMFYAAGKQMSVRQNWEEIGIPLELYIPEEKVVIETAFQSPKLEKLKAFLCEKRHITFLKVPYKAGDDEVAYATKIKKIFQKVHIFIRSDAQEDVRLVQRRFMQWKVQMKERKDEVL